jgi:hypothetical protein
MIQSFSKHLTTSTPIRSKNSKSNTFIDFDFSLLDYDPPLSDFICLTNNNFHESIKNKKQKIKFDLREFCKQQLQSQDQFSTTNKKSKTIKIKIKKRK